MLASQSKQNPELINISDWKNKPNTLEHAIELIGRIPNLEIWFDEFHVKNFIKRGDGSATEVCDTDIIDLTVRLQAEFGYKRVTDPIVKKAICFIASKNPKDELKDWADNLASDGTQRIDSFFHRGLGAQDSEYIRAASRNFFISIAARIYKPGCQCDTMAILEGVQGAFKSSALREIGGKYYCENSESPTNKDFPMNFQGKVIVELAELSSLAKAEVNAVKQTLSRPVDRYRPPYGHLTQDFPRRCILVGTTNDSQYLKDSTGGRRFWPIKVGQIDLEYIKENREQLFAEAVHRFKAGETWWEMPLEATLAEQEARRQEDPWETLIERYLIERNEPHDSSVTVSHILEHGLKIDASKQNKPEEMRVAQVLRSLGWEKVRNGSERTRAWRKLK